MLLVVLAVCAQPLVCLGQPAAARLLDSATFNAVAYNKARYVFVYFFSPNCEECEARVLRF